MYILNKLLSREHLDAGLSLEEDTENVYLKHNGEVVVRFDRDAKLEYVLYEADQIVNQVKSGVEFVKEIYKEADRENRRIITANQVQHEVEEIVDRRGF